VSAIRPHKNKDLGKNFKKNTVFIAILVGKRPFLPAKACALLNLLNYCEIRHGCVDLRQFASRKYASPAIVLHTNGFAMPSRRPAVLSVNSW
jgi:hypothetical protein